MPDLDRSAVAKLATPSAKHPSLVGVPAKPECSALPAHSDLPPYWALDHGQQLERALVDLIQKSQTTEDHHPGAAVLVPHPGDQHLYAHDVEDREMWNGFQINHPCPNN